MREENIPTNDLFALIDPLKRHKFWTDTYHYNTEGRKMPAQQIAENLRAALGKGSASAPEAQAALKAAPSEIGPNGKTDTTR